MDPYTSERWMLERHEHVVRTAELRSRLLTAGDRASGLNIWVASRLRGLADRLEGHGSFEKATQ